MSKGDELLKAYEGVLRHLYDEAAVDEESGLDVANVREAVGIDGRMWGRVRQLLGAYELLVARGALLTDQTGDTGTVWLTADGFMEAADLFAGESELEG